MADRVQARARLAELFRERGFAATSLPDISEATGLGKGSLYNLFPGGKQQMLAEVITDVNDWFEQHIFTPLEAPHPDLGAMFDAVTAYFDTGRRLCLIGRIGLEPGLEELSTTLSRYFARWHSTLAMALRATGHSDQDAHGHAEQIIVSIQGALVLAHTSDDPSVFARTIARLRTIAEAPSERRRDTDTSDRVPHSMIATDPRVKGNQ